MQRDMHKLRALVLIVESDNQRAITDLIPDAGEYVQLAVEAGLLSGIQTGGGSPKHYIAPSLALTPAGHDFASLARNQAIWDTVAQRIAERTGDAPFAVWLGLLEAEYKKALNAD